MSNQKDKLDSIPNQAKKNSKGKGRGASTAVATRPKSISGELLTPGRPTTFSKELADSICEMLSEGRSLRSICRNDTMPAIRTVFMWLRTNEEFMHQYALSKRETADAMAEDIQEIGERVLSGELDPNAARVAIDAKKWVAAKLKPKVYGDKLDVTSGGEKVLPIIALPNALPDVKSEDE